jgi:hypothetical protein
MTCQIAVQRITDSSSRSDQVLVSATDHLHSPNLTYNPARQRYLLAYVVGEDYLPPTLFGAETADCGNNASSTSRIKAVEFNFQNDIPQPANPFDVSDVNGGAFRPRLAYHAGLNQYLLAWEDRRNASGQTYAFDVYAQRLNGDLSMAGGDIVLALGGDYTNFDASATWTPRPVVAVGATKFLLAWFSRAVQGTAVVWSVTGRLVAGSGSPAAAFKIMQMTFAQSHSLQPPTGFLAATYSSFTQEYLVGMTSHLESLWGYLSLALIQRLGSNGQLRKLDGTAQSLPSVGYSVDYENDDQIALGLAANPIVAPSLPDYLVVYSKHVEDRPSQDFDIWGTGIDIKNYAFLPTVLKIGNPLR